MRFQNEFLKNLKISWVAEEISGKMQMGFPQEMTERSSRIHYLAVLCVSFCFSGNAVGIPPDINSEILQIVPSVSPQKNLSGVFLSSFLHIVKYPF